LRFPFVHVQLLIHPHIPEKLHKNLKDVIAKFKALRIRNLQETAITSSITYSGSLAWAYNTYFYFLNSIMHKGGSITKERWK